MTCADGLEIGHISCTLNTSIPSYEGPCTVIKGGYHSAGAKVRDVEVRMSGDIKERWLTSHMI